MFQNNKIITDTRFRRISTLPKNDILQGKRSVPHVYILRSNFHSNGTIPRLNSAQNEFNAFRQHSNEIYVPSYHFGTDIKINHTAFVTNQHLHPLPQANVRKNRSNFAAKCPMCGKKLANSWSLKQHVRRHSGEKPFSCTVSLYFFFSKFFFSKHTQTSFLLFGNRTKIVKSDFGQSIINESMKKYTILLEAGLSINIISFFFFFFVAINHSSFCLLFTVCLSCL